MLFVEFAFKGTNRGLTVTDISADFLATYAEIAVVLELVVLEHAEVFLSVAHLILDLTNISVRLGLQVAELLTELSNCDIHWAVNWCA